MTTERCLDSNNAEVELRFRIVNKLKSGKSGRQLKSTINCYHASTYMHINGSKTDLFVDNILPCIEKEVQNVHSQEDNLSEINNRIQISLTSENIRKQDNIDIGEEINTNKEILSIKYIDIDQDRQYECPICQQQANRNTIACEECDGWFHFECLGLTSKDIKKIEENAPYICKACIENQLFQFYQKTSISILMNLRPRQLVHLRAQEQL